MQDARHRKVKMQETKCRYKMQETAGAHQVAIEALQSKTNSYNDW